MTAPRYVADGDGSAKLLICSYEQCLLRLPCWDWFRRILLDDAMNDTSCEMHIVVLGEHLLIGLACLFRTLAISESEGSARPPHWPGNFCIVLATFGRDRETHTATEPNRTAAEQKKSR